MSWFIEQLKSFGKRPAMCFDDEIVSYDKLCEKIDVYSKETFKNLARGSVVALISDCSPDSIALFLALVENKNVIVPVFTANQGEIEYRINNAFVDAVIRGKYPNIQIQKIENQIQKHPLIKKLIDKNSSGLILFSSGSTGTPKAMLHDLDKLILSYKRNYTKDINTLLFLAIDHIGGIDTLFRQLSIGGTLTIPDIRSPDRICKLIEKFKVNVLPASPTFLNLLLLSESYKTYDLSSLSIIGYGAETMNDRLLERLHEAFPSAKIQQKFGTSETGAVRVRSYSSESTYMKIEDPNVEFKFVNDELWIRTKTSIDGYLNLHMDNFTEDGWFKTNDSIETIEGGYFRIIGRLNEIINVGGQKVFPTEVESVLMQMPELADCLVYGEKNIITGEVVAAQVVLRSQTKQMEIKKQIRQFCADKLELYKIPVIIKIVDKTNFGERYKKIRRDVATTQL